MPFSPLYFDAVQNPITNDLTGAPHVSRQGRLLEGMGVSVRWNVSETRCDRSAILMRDV